MKILKRLLAVLVATGLSFGLTAGVALAAPSASANTPTVVNNGSTADRYVISRIKGSGSYNRISRYAPKVISLFDDVEDAINNGQSATTALQALVNGLQAIADGSDSDAPESVRTSAKTILDQIKNSKEPLTSFFDIDKTGDNVPKSSSGNYLITLKVPTITTSTKGIVVLHFNENTKEWELVTPTSTDLANQEITIELTSLGATMVLCDSGTGNGVTSVTSNTSGVSVSGSGSTTKSPKTGVADNWMYFAAAAVVLAGAGAVALRKKRA